MGPNRGGCGLFDASQFLGFFLDYPALLRLNYPVWLFPPISGPSMCWWPDGHLKNVWGKSIIKFVANILSSVTPSFVLHTRKNNFLFVNAWFMREEKRIVRFLLRLHAPNLYRPIRKGHPINNTLNKCSKEFAGNINCTSTQPLMWSFANQFPYGNGGKSTRLLLVCWKKNHDRSTVHF